MLNQNPDPNPHKVSNFWFGFAVGASLTSAAAFLLGTKKGRKFLKQTLDLSEDLQENLLLLGEEFAENLADKREEVEKELKTLPKHIDETVTHIRKEHRGFDAILNKIRTLSPKPVKKFFAKENS